MFSICCMFFLICDLIFWTFIGFVCPFYPFAVHIKGGKIQATWHLFLLSWALSILLYAIWLLYGFVILLIDVWGQRERHRMDSQSSLAVVFVVFHDLNWKVTFQMETLWEFVQHM